MVRLQVVQCRGRGSDEVMITSSKSTRDEQEGQLSLFLSLLPPQPHYTTLHSLKQLRP